MTRKVLYNLIIKIMFKIGVFSLILFSLLIGAAGVDARSEGRRDDENRRVRAFGKSCEFVVAHADEKVVWFDKHTAKYESVYNKLKTRLTSLVDKYKNAGLNTANLEADIATLETKIAKFMTDRAALRTDLVELQSVDCDDTAVFQAKMNEIKQDKATLRADAKDIKKFFRTEIRPELKVLKSQLEQDA